MSGDYPNMGALIGASDDSRASVELVNLQHYLILCDGEWWAVRYLYEGGGTFDPVSAIPGWVEFDEPEQIIPLADAVRALDYKAQVAELRKDYDQSLLALTVARKMFAEHHENAQSTEKTLEKVLERAVRIEELYLKERTKHDELEAENARLRAALETLSKVRGSANKVEGLWMIQSVADIASHALKG